MLCKLHASIHSPTQLLCAHEVCGRAGCTFTLKMGKHSWKLQVFFNELQQAGRIILPVRSYGC